MFPSFAAAVVLLGTLLTLIAAERRTARVEENYPPEGRFIEANGHPVHYVTDGQGPDIVVIHGSMGSTRDATFALMPALVAAGFRVTAFDRPGLGYTPRLAERGVTVDQQVDLLVRASAELGLQKPIIVGQSYGGALAVNWALNYPDDLSAVVSIAGATHPWEGPLDLTYRVLSWPVIGPLSAQVVTAFLPDEQLNAMVEEVFAPDDMPDGYVEHFGPRLNLSPRRLVANSQQRTDLREHLRAQAPRYGEISVPVEIIHGEADTIVGVSVHAEKLVQDVQDGHLTRLPGAGHMPHHTDTQAVVDAIERAALRAGVK